MKSESTVALHAACYVWSLLFFCHISYFVTETSERLRVEFDSQLAHFASSEVIMPDVN